MQYLLKALVLPLLALTAAAMCGSRLVHEPWSGLFVNLAASFVGSIITVFYIDAVMKRHRRAQWIDVEDTVKKFVERVANVCVAGCRTALGVGSEAVYFGPNVEFYSREWRRRMAEFAKNMLTPMLPSVRDLDEKAWKTLAHNLQAASACADRVVGLFGSHIDTPVMHSVLELQETADGIVALYSTFPDICGVPADRLQPKRDGSSSGPTQNGLYDYATRELGKLLSQCAGLLRSLDSDA